MTKAIRHRGPDPEDAELFGPGACERLRQATRDLCWLLDRGYALASATELTGNRYELTRRQRVAVARGACSCATLDRLRARELPPQALAGQELWIDGFNVLLVLESALGGGVVLIGCDQCCRDVAGLHRRYTKVQETVPALRALGQLTQEWQVTQCRWWLDSPIANSGRLRALMLDLAAAAHWPWQVELVTSPDRVLAHAGQIVATSDRGILDRCDRWVNLACAAIHRHAPHARLLDLSL